MEKNKAGIVVYDTVNFVDGVHMGVNSIFKYKYYFNNITREYQRWNDYKIYGIQISIEYGKK